MKAAEITGKKAGSRSLRHSTGVMLALDKVSLNVIQDILGINSLKVLKYICRFLVRIGGG